MLLIAGVMTWEVGAGPRPRRRRRATGRSRGQARERAETLDHQNQPDKALLWLARGIANAAAAGDADLEQTLRTDLAGRRHAVHAHRALAALPIDGIMLAISPDGRTLAVADPDMATRVLDLATGQPVGEPIPTLYPTDPTIARTFGDLKFAPDGKSVLTRISEDSRGSLGFISARGTTGRSCGTPPRGGRSPSWHTLVG